MNDRAVAYYRQSHERQDSVSIELQQSADRAYAKAKGYRLVAEVEDEGRSGTEHVLPWRKRPGFAEVINLAQKGQVDVLILYRWSRLSRTRKAQIEITEELDKLGVRIEAATEAFDPTTAGGRFARDQMLQYAAFESDLKSEQWREALDRRLRNGLPKNGLPRFGYVKQDGMYIPDPVTGDILRQLYLKYTAGAGITSLRNWLNEQSIRTTRGNQWTSSSVSHVLDSGFGAGLLIQSGDTYAEGAHEPVITRIEWEQFQRVRESRKAAPPRRRTARWHLAGLATCGLCGTRLHAKRQHVMCGLNANSGKTACTGVWMSRRNFETRISLWIGGHVEDFPERADARADVESHVRTLESALDEVLARLAKAASGWTSGLLDDDSYRAVQAGLLAERAAAERALRDARDERDRLAPVDADVYSRLEVGDVTASEWNALLARVLRRVELWPDRIVMVPVVGEAATVPRP